LTLNPVLCRFNLAICLEGSIKIAAIFCGNSRHQTRSSTTDSSRHPAILQPSNKNKPLLLKILSSSRSSM
jgi:hypothetical protein